MVCLVPVVCAIILQCSTFFWCNLKHFYSFSSNCHSYTNLIFIAISVCSSEVILTLACLNAAIAIHRGLLYNVLRQPMYFFEIRPIGRIVSRLSKDITDIDTELPFNCYEVIESGLIVSFVLKWLHDLVVRCNRMMVPAWVHSWFARLTMWIFLGHCIQ